MACPALAPRIIKLAASKTLDCIEFMQ